MSADSAGVSTSSLSETSRVNTRGRPNDPIDVRVCQLAFYCWLKKFAIKSIPTKDREEEVKDDNYDLGRRCVLSLLCIKEKRISSALKEEDMDSS